MKNGLLPRASQDEKCYARPYQWDMILNTLWKHSKDCKCCPVSSAPTRIGNSYHCSKMGPILGPRVPMGTFLGFRFFYTASDFSGHVPTDIFLYTETLSYGLSTLATPYIYILNTLNFTQPGWMKVFNALKTLVHSKAANKSQKLQNCWIWFHCKVFQLLSLSISEHSGAFPWWKSQKYLANMFCQ